MAYVDEKEQKYEAIEKVFTLYENERYSIFQSIANESGNRPQFEDQSISNELRHQCKTDHCLNIVTKDVNRVDDFARIAAIYHDSCVCINEARKKTQLIAHNDEGKDDFDEQKQKPTNVIQPFMPILFESYTKTKTMPNAKNNQSVLIPRINYSFIAASTGKETSHQNETEFQTDGMDMEITWGFNVGINYASSKLHRGLGGKNQFKYHAPDKNNILSDNVFELPDFLDNNLRVGLIGDWGSGTEVARDLLEILLSKKPDIIIHLGDVYYSGTKKEFDNNYCNILNDYRKKYHKCVVLSIPGNHDWYGGGKPFYKAVRSLNKAECVPKWFELN